jgi:hypothetical protein
VFRNRYIKYCCFWGHEQIQFNKERTGFSINDAGTTEQPQAKKKKKKTKQILHRSQKLTQNGSEKGNEKDLYSGNYETMMKLRKDRCTK